MLQALSKGQYTSTTHRVINESFNYTDNEMDKTDRISIPIFIHCKEDTFLNEKEGTAKEYLQNRLKLIHKE